MIPIWIWVKGSTGSNVGTGGMNTKLTAAKIATKAGADMLIANSRDIRIIHRLMDGRNTEPCLLPKGMKILIFPAL